MKRQTLIILCILGALLSVAAVSGWLNHQQARERLEALESAEIVVFEDGTEIARLTREQIDRFDAKEYSARFKSSLMRSPEEHTYAGVAVSELFAGLGIRLEDKKQVRVSSLDGYVVTFQIDEIKEKDNVLLVFRDNGQPLGTYGEADGQGPYMIVVRDDPFSQRWAKYVCRLDIL